MRWALATDLDHRQGAKLHGIQVVKPCRFGLASSPFTTRWPVSRWSRPEGRPCRLHRLVDDGKQLGEEAVKIDLVAGGR